MRARIIVGSNYGDEGKGTVTARYARDTDNVLNILTNGGSQRGHSIITKDGGVTFQHFGSGTYHGADNYYSRFFILNPMQFAKEYEALLVKPRNIYRDRLCRWTTPYDSMANLIAEQQKGSHGSCCMGIWNTVRRCRDTQTPLFDDFVGSGKELSFLLEVKRYYEREMDIPSGWRSVWDSPNIALHFVNDCRFMAEHTTAVSLSSLQYENLLFENGQGLLLCDTGKDTSDTTPSHTGVKYALDLIRDIGGVGEVTAHYVTRPYLTRHGDGYLQGETFRKQISSSIEEDRTNHYNEFQGEFRYGHLDLRDLKARIEADAGSLRYEVELTHCDEMDRVEEFSKAFGHVNVYDSPMI